MTGTPYIVSPEAVRNQFLVRVVNKQDVRQSFRLELVDVPGALERLGFVETVELGSLGEQVLPLVLQMPRDAYIGRFHVMVVLHDSANTFTLEREIEFIGPDPQLLQDDRP